MTKSDLVQNGSIKEFFAFMNERQAIYERRQSGQAPPWTDDPILRDYFFCNVFREQDATTKWIAENWRNRKAPPDIMIFNMVVARFFNWPPTLDAIGWTRNWPKKRDRVAVELFVNQSSLGNKIFGEAYLVAGSDLKGKTKIAGVCDRLDWAWEHRHKLAAEISGKAGFGLEGQSVSLAKAWWILQDIPGVAGFVAYEIVTDLRHTPLLNEAPDIMTWANPGPGAVRGLHRIFGRDTSRKNALALMQGLMMAYPEYTKLHLEMRDIEHTLCEYDKYKRIEQAIKEGRPVLGMRKYHGA